ncbi:MAG: ABC transporter ATP-binding protein [Acetatifactor sp.]|nr:ABC transporter ATP-binding protein [Acetatifactor sp.]
MIRIENLSVAFDGAEVVKNVSLDLVDGEVLGVVGESGSGKSVTALTLMGLVSESAQITSGRVLFDDVVLQEAGKPRDQALYRRYQGAQMSMIFQEPMTSLNPTQRVGRQVEEMLWLHAEHRPQGPWKHASDALLMSGRRTGQKEEFRTRVLEAFHAVGLRDEERVYASYPHQLSGGMRQRVMIAMALILHPRLLVADEPTTALDVTVQNQIIALLRKINSKQNNAMLFITHDLNLARRLCGRIAVMKDGQVVELGETEEIFRHPRQEYTKRLMEAVPSRMKKRTWAAGMTPDSSVPVVRVHDLSVFYQDGSNSLFAQKKKQCVVADASFEIYPGESLGLVGESGCGKTSLSKAILGMNRDIRGEIVSNTIRPQMVFQDPYSSLNPTKTIGWLLQEPLRAAGALDQSKAMTRADMEAAAYDMLHRVGMEDKYFHRKPSQLSGGQRQRVSIGQALITHPGLVVADEPVSALDVTIQAQIMELMRRLQQEMKLAYLFISHDINVVYQMCDRIMVMKEGRIIEVGETEKLFRAPREEYTRELLSSS